MLLEKTKILVTGGAGFVGSHLVERLLREEASVRILDNFSTGDLRNIEAHLGQVELIKGDIRDPAILPQAVRGVELVFHEAAQINPAKAVQDPLFDFEVNVTGTINLLLEAHRQKVKKFIMASTNVYGNADCQFMKEDFPTLAVRHSLLSPYAAAKVAAEAYLKVLNDEMRLPTVRLRYTNVYGPRQLSKSESGVIALFVKAALLGQPMRIFGDGTHSRDFVHVNDVVNANILAALHEEANGEVFNVGTGVETSVNELAAMINQIAQTQVPVEHVEDRAADFVRVKADLTQSRRVLNYQPTVLFRDGLAQYIDWCRQNRERL
jgi:UDP-glucose 4-epimerase